MVKTLKETATRNSNTEILRIIAMIMIVASHYSFHGGIDFSQVHNPLNYLFLKIITLGNCGVDIFILIYGYYSVSREKINDNKAFVLWFQVFTYAVSIWLAFLLSGKYEFSLNETIRSIFPTIFSKYWFFTAYIVFFLLSPFINKLLKSLSQNEYRLFLGSMFLVWSVIPTIFNRVPAGDGFALFLVLYALGAYFKLYPQSRYNCRKCGIIMSMVSALLLMVSAVVFFWLKKFHPLFDGRETFFFHKNSVLVISLALGLLIMALNKSPQYNKPINLIASCTFGVYLLHDNDLIREYIWGNIFRVPQFADTPLLVIHCIGTVAIIFGAGVAIEITRKQTLEKLGVCFYEGIKKRIREKRIRGKKC